MKITTDERRIWIQCAALAGVSALFALLMNWRFARYRPTNGLLPKPEPGDATPAPWDKPAPEEKAQAEPARRALDQATAQVDSPEKANRVAERLEELAGGATTGEVEQSAQAEKPGSVPEKVAESSQRITQAAKSAPAEEKAAHGIAQAAKEITASPGRERVALAKAAEETLSPEQPDAAHPEQREYLRQAVLKRMKPLDAVDARIFLAVNHLPHSLWLNWFFYFFTFTFTGGMGWYLTMALNAVDDPRGGVRVIRRNLLPLAIASSLVEFPIKAFFRRRRPFIDYIQAIVIGKKPGSWSFPSGHSAAAFAGARLLSLEFPSQSPLIFLFAFLVAFSRIYLGDHYPGDVVSGAVSGMSFAEIVRRAQQIVVRNRQMKNRIIH
jgi:undecaprenyl-diphosphatase